LELLFWALYILGVSIAPLGNIISNSDVGWATVAMLVLFWGEDALHPLVAWGARAVPVFSALLLIGVLWHHRSIFEEWYMVLYLVVSWVLLVLRDLNRREQFAVLVQMHLVSEEIERDLEALCTLMNAVAPPAEAKRILRSVKREIDSLSPDAADDPLRRACVTHCTTRPSDNILIILQWRSDTQGASLLALDRALSECHCQSRSSGGDSKTSWTLVASTRNIAVLEPSREVDADLRAAAALKAVKSLREVLRGSGLKAILLRSTCVGAVLGQTSVNFMYVGPEVSVGVALLDEIDWGRVVATPRYISGLGVYLRGLCRCQRTTPDGWIEDPARSSTAEVLDLCEETFGTVVRPALPWTLRAAGRVLLHDLIFLDVR
jgi:hypothetical protein